MINGVARDAADDNLNAFDPFPPGHTGEANDLDFYDPAGGLILPVDRFRRYVTPPDINGTGSVTPWTSGIAAGADPLGRVLFYSYYRPPGSPGSIASSPNTLPPPTGTLPATVGTLGAIYYPLSNATGNNFFYTQGPNNNPNNLLPSPTLVPFLPDVTNNPLHAFEFFRLPPTISGGSVTNHVASGSFTFQFTGSNRVGGAMPVSPLPPPPATATNIDKYKFPIAYPTYNYETNSSQHTDGLNDADEMNLYVPNPQADSPFGPADLEWLYRQQDVDGSSLVSRLAQLAPVSFTNPIDGQRRRRLFTTDSWEMNNFAWTNDNPGNAFPTNSRYTPTANAGFTTLNVPAFTNPNILPPILTILNPTNAAPSPTPSLAHRDKKINLNYPLPVSNSPDEPIRQKWISDAYQLMKSMLPPMAVDTPDELAALSQFLVNVIDFRDPDCTMTHFRNPDVKVVLGSIGAAAPVYNPTYLAPIGATIPATQHGDPPGPVRHGVQPDRDQRGPGVLVPVGDEYPNQPLLRRAGQHPVPDGHRGCQREWQEPSTSGCLDARSVAGQLRHGDDGRRPGQPARPVHRPTPAHPDGQLLRPDSVQPGDRDHEPAVHRRPADVQLTPLYAVGPINNPPTDSPPGTDFPTNPPYPTSYFYVIGNPPVPNTRTFPRHRRCS